MCGDVCTCIYMDACRVHACVMPYFGLAINIFIVFNSCLLEASHNKICIGRLNFFMFVCEFICTCTHVSGTQYLVILGPSMCACLNWDALLWLSS